MALTVKVNDPHLQYQLRIPQDAYLLKIWWIHLKSVTSYRAEQGNVHGRKDGRADGRTEVGNDNTPSAWKGKG